MLSGSRLVMVHVEDRNGGGMSKRMGLLMASEDVDMCAEITSMKVPSLTE